MRVLGIESSCDETAAAVVTGGPRDRAPRLAASVVASQTAVHRPFGGVVPELASRAHVRWVTDVMEQALDRAGIRAADLDAVAATAGPGLAGSLLVGLTAGKSLARLLGRPFYAVNHIEAHVYAAFLAAPDLAPPLLALVASGGHTELIHLPRHRAFRILGRTRDDAAGEAYDKAAKLLGLGYPGGPKLERLAARGGRRAVTLPVARLKSGGLDFSFSGLKTAVALAVPKTRSRADLAAGFQRAVIDALAGRTREALARTRAPALVLGGGVAANGALRARFEALARDLKVRLVVPPMGLCTDNAAMIAATAWYRARRPGRGDPLSTPADPAWVAGTPVPAAAAAA